MSIFEIIGWIGSLFYLLSYFLLSIQKMDANKVPYQFMNVMGGLCLVICAYDTQDRPNLFTNLIWMLIGLFAIGRIIRVAKRKKG